MTRPGGGICGVRPGKRGEPMEVQAYAKLNLSLDILGKRPDGYHELRMVMQSISLADTLTLTEHGGEGLRVRANLHFLPTGERNLAAAAALRFWEARGQEPEDLDIAIEKRIPVCAGMAGGRSSPRCRPCPPAGWWCASPTSRCPPRSCSPRRTG